MIDDYQYKQTPIPSSPDDEFGFGGKSKFGLGSTIGPAYDQAGRASSPDFNAYSNDTYVNNGSGYVPPSAGYGSTLWYNSNEWAVFDASTESGPVIMKQDGGTPYWERLATGFTFGDMLYWDGGGWAIIPAAGASGIHVLASNGGTPYWIETESC